MVRARTQVISILVGALLLIAAATVSATPARRLAFFDLFGQPLVKPSRVFLTADAGPYLTKLKWSGWGTARATATGTYVSTCASCAPPRFRSVTLKLRTILSCPKKHTGAYRFGSMRTLSDTTHKPVTTAYDTGYTTYCR